MFRTTGYVLKRKPPGLTRSIQNLENVDAVRKVDDELRDDSFG